MKRTCIALLIAAAALAGGLLAGRSFAPPSDAVRMVDIARLLQEFEPMDREFRALQAKYQEHGDRLTRAAEQLKSDKGALAQINPSSEEYALRSFELQRNEKALQDEAEFWSAAQRRESEALLDRSVRRIHQACEEYGKRTGVSAVLMRPGPLPPTGDARNALRDLEGRWVVWANPDHDVTDAVLAILREQG